MNTLELFAGSRSFSKVAEELGHETFAVDINDFENIDYVTDILEFDYSKIPFKPDVIWASPPCTYFSVASIGKHWYQDHTPKTEQAKLGVKIVNKTIEIIEMFQPDYFFVENPRGKLRKLGLFKGIAERTFKQSFKLSEYMNVKDAKLKDGMLNITLVQDLPKEKQPKQIKIN